MEDLRDLWHPHTEFMKNELLKEQINYIYYTLILSGLKKVDTYDNIEKFKAEIRNWGEKLKHNNKVTEIINTRITLGYMNYSGIPTFGP